MSMVRPSDMPLPPTLASCHEPSHECINPELSLLAFGDHGYLVFWASTLCIRLLASMHLMTMNLITMNLITMNLITMNSITMNLISMNLISMNLKTTDPGRLLRPPRYANFPIQLARARSLLPPPPCHGVSDTQDATLSYF
jgi:hypothetical protein